ncbi:uncharacterized protein B0H18DRAFT_1102667 [Fomitopsis serialis]|uniref:uncharacterized protein n=1 Tax=Fomitopsis serialis TaxID=139415 RepID=UPI0020082D2C|nr:uncharacterized protein B0H18DRAFT_1102667 [Neoantrodia serialis]KAH9931509.1 hypothetical protein B0H18DRAFT_1102667 [Neoantrodia serialis]
MAGRQARAVCTDCFTYCGLAILDLLVHVIPVASSRLSVFKPLDIVIGALSSLPLLLYISFLYTFTASQFIPSLPRQFRPLARQFLIFFLPVIVAANEIGSFTGISYRVLNNGLYVGFTNPYIHVGFDSLTLVVLLIYQLLIFSLAAYRLARAFRYRQDLVTEKSDGSELKTQMFRGSPWLVAGMLLGTLETTLGFPGGGFALALIRRVLRMLSRACLIIGLFNGYVSIHAPKASTDRYPRSVDTVEDFHMLKMEAVQQRRRSKLLGLIGNPRNSTFRQLEGYQYDPETGGLRPKLDRLSLMASNALDEIRTISIRLGNSPRSSLRPADSTAPDSSVEAVIHERTVTPPINIINHPSAAEIPSSTVRLRDPPLRPRPQERVTVHWGNGLSPPQLELRRVSDLLDQTSLVRLTQLGIDPYGDVHPHMGVFRAMSLPTHVAMEEWAAVQRDHPSLRRFNDDARARYRSSPPPMQSRTSLSPSGYSQTVEEAEAFTSLSREGSVFSVPSSAVIAPVVRVERAYARHTYGGPQQVHRRGSSYASSIELLQALAAQFPGTPHAGSPSQDAFQASHAHSASRDSDVTMWMTVGDQSLARADSWDARTLPSHSRGPSKDLLTSPMTIEEEPEPRMSEDSTLIGHGSHKKRISTDSKAVAAFPTPTSLLTSLPSPPASVSEEDLQARLRERARKARTLDATRTQPLRMDSVDSAVTDEFADLPPARPRVPRIKSVGVAPRRYTPTPTNSSIFTRESVAVELESVNEVSSDQRKSRKLSKRSRKSSTKSSKKDRKSMVSEGVYVAAGTMDAGRSVRSVFED